MEINELKSLFGEKKPSLKKFSNLVKGMPDPDAFRKEVYGYLFCNFTKLPVVYQNFAISLFYQKDDLFLNYLITETLLSAIRLPVSSKATFKKGFSYWNKTLMFNKTSNYTLASTLLLGFDIGFNSSTLEEYLRKNTPDEDLSSNFKKHPTFKTKKEVKRKSKNK